MNTVHQTPGNPAPPHCRPRRSLWRASVATLPRPHWPVIDDWLADHAPLP